MKKNKTKIKDNITPIQIKSLKDFISLDLAICLLITMLLFLPTINRPWLVYDERILFDGLYFPQLINFKEFFEVISNFGLDFNVISSNSMYSSNYVRRTCPLSQVLGILVTFFLKKDPIKFHIFNLFLHLVNVCLVYFILKFFIKINTKTLNLFSNKTNLYKRLISIFLTLIWATHPVMMEPILLSTNFGATFSYIFFFGLFLDFIKNRERKQSLKKKALLAILFLTPMLINEYIVALPLILFLFSFYKTFQSNNFKKAIFNSMRETTPYFCGLFLYIIYFFLISHYQTSQNYTEMQLPLLLERVFWLSPQIFFYTFKLLFLPKLLSIDQSIFVKLGKTLYDPYSIACIVFSFFWLFVPFILFVVKKRTPVLFFLSWGYFLAFLPFIHILMPSYTLIAERYFYTPFAIIIFALGIFLSSITQTRSKIILTFLLLLILGLCLTRSFIRTFDWKDNYSFINSSYETSKDPFFKAIRLGMLGKSIYLFEPQNKAKETEYFRKTLGLLLEAKKEAEINKDKYQDSLPKIIKSYGLDYESLLAKIAFLEASSRCLELKEDYRVGLQLLEPFISNKYQPDPRVFELYANLLINDRRFQEAENILLKANSKYPHLAILLLNLFDIEYRYKNNIAAAEQYLKEALKYYPYDIAVLAKAVGFYQSSKNLLLAAHYAYLYGIRMQSVLTYKFALSTYLDYNEFKIANNIVQKLLILAPEDPECLYLVSRFYYKTKDYNKSVSYLEKAYLISKNTPNNNANSVFEVGYALAKMCIAVGSKDKAVTISIELFKVAEGNKKMLIQLAQLYQSLGLSEQLNSTIKEYEKPIQEQ